MIAKIENPKIALGKMGVMKTKNRYWPDGAAAHAKCPRCGQMGRRTAVIVKRQQTGWMYHHGYRAEQRITGIKEAVMCIVPLPNDKPSNAGPPGVS